MLFIVFLLASLVLGARRYSRNKAANLAERLIVAVMPLGFFLTTCGYLLRNSTLHMQDWSCLRYATALGLAKGIWPYNGPTEGLISGWIYPPFGLVVYLPATLFKDLIIGHRVAGLLSGLSYFLPA